MGKSVSDNMNLLKDISISFIVFLFLINGINVLAQEKSILDTSISINFNNTTLEEALDKLSKKGGFSFSYNTNVIERKKKVSGNYKKQKVKDIINEIIEDSEILIKEVNSQIIFYKKENRFSNNIIKPKKDEYFNIKGKVIGKKSKNGISNVHVFVANTTIGTTTNSEGFFELKKLTKGDFELVFSHVSYVTILKNSKDLNLSSDDLTIELTPHQIQLQEVELVDKKDKNWNRNLQLFTKAFIGSTDNSRKCKILNPWVLEFNVDVRTGKFTASSNELLEIENRKTGYNISIYLKLFEIVDDRPRYLYKAYFEEMEPMGYSQKKRWKRARAHTYKGSLSHFIDALYKGNLKKEGFMVSLSNNLNRKAYNLESFNESEIEKFIKKTSNNDKSELKIAFSNYLLVTYFKRTESNRYLQYLKTQSQNEIDKKLKGPIELKPIHQQSWLKIKIRKNMYLTSNNTLVINPKAIIVNDKKQIVNPLDVEQYGYWAWKRIADELPNDFSLLKR